MKEWVCGMLDGWMSEGWVGGLMDGWIAWILTKNSHMFGMDILSE